MNFWAETWLLGKSLALVNGWGWDTHWMLLTMILLGTECSICPVSSQCPNDFSLEDLQWVWIQCSTLPNESVVLLCDPHWVCQWYAQARHVLLCRGGRRPLSNHEPSVSLMAGRLSYSRLRKMTTELARWALINRDKSLILSAESISPSPSLNWIEVEKVRVLLKRHRSDAKGLKMH